MRHGTLILDADRVASVLSEQYHAISQSRPHPVTSSPGTSPFSQTYLPSAFTEIPFVSSFQPNHSTKMLLTSLHFYNIIKKGKFYWKQLQKGKPSLNFFWNCPTYSNSSVSACKMKICKTIYLCINSNINLCNRHKQRSDKRN